MGAPFRKVRAGGLFLFPRRWHPRSRSHFASFASVPSHRIPPRPTRPTFEVTRRVAVGGNGIREFRHDPRPLNDPLNDLAIDPTDVVG